MTYVCTGCGKQEEDAAVLISMKGITYTCEECVLIMVAMVTSQPSDMNRWKFFTDIIELLRDPLDTFKRIKKIADKEKDDLEKRNRS